MTISGNTADYTISYVDMVPGGIGLYGIITSGDLYATIIGESFESSYSNLLSLIVGKLLPTSDYTKTQKPVYIGLPTTLGQDGALQTPDLTATYRTLKALSESELYANILPIQSGTGFSSHTTSQQSIYIGVPTTLGQYSTSLTPDLTAVYTIIPKTTSGTSDLVTVITPLYHDDKDLRGYIRTAESGSLDLETTYTGYCSSNLLGYIIPTFTGSNDVSSHIEPIPPAELGAIYLRNFPVDISGTIEPVPFVVLEANISGAVYKDLISSISGFYLEDLQAVYSGYYAKDLRGILHGFTAENSSLTSQYRGVRGSDLGNLQAYIKTSNSGTSSISGYILPVYYKNLNARISGYDTYSLDATISGDYLQSQLPGIITPTGSLNNLLTSIRPQRNGSLELYASISGYGYSDLIATIELDKSAGLGGTITPAGPFGGGEVLARIQAEDYKDLEVNVYAEKQHSIIGVIEPIEAVNLYASIVPKIFYIEADLPINTYAIKDLKVLVNSTPCDHYGMFSDLGVYISGTNYEDLTAKLVVTSGQLAIAEDFLSITLNNSIRYDDWKFLIAANPILVESYLPIIITNNPYLDLFATIEGVQEHSDIAATIDSVYVPSIPRVSNTAIGEWVNDHTGERKSVTIYFRGDVDTFYYSPDTNKTFASSKNFLEVVVESYELEGTKGSLLAVKKSVNTHVVSNLSSFSSLDEAIKYAIVGAVGELHGSLSAYIEAKGETSDLSAYIDRPDPKFIRDLKANLIPVTNDPILSGTITPTGDIKNLTAQIKPVYSQITATPFQGIDNKYYMPTLQIAENGDYSIILIETPSGSLDFSRPDLYASISGLGAVDLPTTITGL